MSYCTILTVVDENTASTVTAHYAITLAASCKARLILYAVHATGCHDVLIDRTEVHLDHLQAVSTGMSVPVTRITEIGNIRSLLPKRAEIEKADLVFYPITPGERYGSKFKLHTVHHLLRTVTSDLAIMRAITMGKPHPGNILVPLGKVVSDDGRGLKFVAELARSFHAQVTLFHLFDGEETNVMPDDIIQFGKKLQLQDVFVLERGGRGQLGKSITVEAITRRNDLIVIGTSGRGVLRRLFLSNPVSDVMHMPPCNVILFRLAC